MTLTNQEIFDKALQGIRNQDYKASRDGAACMYHGGDGIACVVGHCVSLDTRKAWDQLFNDPSCPSTLISDVYRHRQAEYLKYFTGNQLEFLVELQQIHDGVLVNSRRKKFENCMADLANAYNLEYTLP